jgi:hypothetical protein
MALVQPQQRIRNPKMTSIPAWVKNVSMGPGGRAFRLAWINAVAYSNNGWKKVAAEVAKKQKGKQPAQVVQAD